MRNNEEHKRLKDLLTDTITLLCKNGLSYSEEFSVDALIGITLDKQEVVLVSIKESIKTVEETLEKEGIEESIDDMDSDYTPTTTKHKKRKRKRSKEHISRKIDRQSGGESDDCFTEFYAASTPSKRLLQNPPQPLKEQQHQQVNSTALNVSVKQEKQDNENEDPVFVKAEKNRDMDKLTSDTPGENNISPAPVFSPPHITTDLSLHNTSGTAEDSINSTPHQVVEILPDYYESRIPKTKYLQCTLCAKLLKGKQGMQRHLQGAHKIGPSYKCDCGSVFTWEWSFRQHKKKCKALEGTCHISSNSYSKTN